MPYSYIEPWGSRRVRVEASGCPESLHEPRFNDFWCILLAEFLTAWFVPHARSSVSVHRFGSRVRMLLADKY